MSRFAASRIAAGEQKNAEFRSNVRPARSSVTAMDSSTIYTGNQAMLRRRLRRAINLQPKLEIGAIDDPLEHEADRVADQVMRMPASGSLTDSASKLQRKCAACEEEDRKVQRHANSAAGLAGEPAPSAVHQVIAQPGRPLDQSSRGFFEPRLGVDLGGVRIHDDSDAARSSRMVGAQAYTVGSHIAFADRVDFGSQAGRRLLAHELAHTVQQQAGRSRGVPSTVARTPQKPFAVNQIDISHLRTTVLRFYEALGPQGRASLSRNTTVVVALVTHENYPTLVYTVAGNSINPAIRTAADGLGLTRWDPEGIDTVAGEHHAEQLTLEAAEKLGFKVEAMAVTRTPCADCAPVVAARGIPIEFVRDPYPRSPTPGTPGGAPPVGPGPGVKPGEAPTVKDEPGSVHDPSHTPGVTEGPRPQTPSAPPTTPSVPAREIAAELAETARTIRLLESVTELVRLSLVVDQFIDILMTALQAYAMAAATLASGSPYAKGVREASAIADRAKELADYYASLDVYRDLPRKGDDAYDSWYQLQQIQFTYLEMESKIHDTLNSVPKSQWNIAIQIKDLNDGLTDKAISATFLPYTSLSVADMYFFAEAGGKMRSSLIDAAVSYTKAQAYIRNADNATEGIIKVIEMRLRELGVQGQVFAGMSDEEVRSTSYEKFNFRDAGD